MRAFRGRLVCLVALGSAVACGGADKSVGPSAPVAGMLRVMLTTPNADDGALMLTITGAAVQQVDAASAQYQVYSAQPDSVTTRVLVTGDIAAGDVVHLHVADVSRVGAYHASLTQAASRTSFAQQVISAYSLTVAR